MLTDATHIRLFVGKQYVRLMLIASLKIHCPCKNPNACLYEYVFCIYIHIYVYMYTNIHSKIYIVHYLYIMSHFNLIIYTLLLKCHHPHERYIYTHMYVYDFAMVRWRWRLWHQRADALIYILKTVHP